MTADSDADDAFTSEMVSSALEAGSNLLFFGWMTGVLFQLFQLFHFHNFNL